MRYELGIAGEDGELLISDSETHVIIARSSSIALKMVRELVQLANAGWESKKVTESVSKEADAGSV